MEGCTSARGSPLKRSAFGWFIPTRRSLRLPAQYRYGFAVVKPGRYSSRPCRSPASHSLRRYRTRPLRSRVRRLRSHACLRPAKPSGQPGHGRPGRWRRLCQSSRRKFLTVGPALPACCPPQTARYPRFSVVAQCLYSKAGACSRGPSSPARPSSRAHSFGPFRPRPGRPSVHPQRRSLPLFQGAQGLPSTALQSPPPPRCQTASPATLRFTSRPWSLGDSETGIRIKVCANAHDITRATVPSQRLPATKADQGDHAPASVLMSASCPARRMVTGI